MYRTVILAVLVALPLVSCGAPRAYQSKLDPLALQQMQSQEFETSKAILFASVVSVFQDTGFTIEAADLETGLVTAKSASQSDRNIFSGTTNALSTKASAFVEVTRPGYAKARLNFVESTDSRTYYGGGGTHDIPIEKADYYEKIFSKIREAVFLREANKAQEPAPGPAPAAAPAATPSSGG